MLIKASQVAIAALLCGTSLAVKVSPRGRVNHHPDYLIIGAGPAGLVLAAELSQNPDVSVVLVEAGPENIGNEAIDIPGYVFTLLNSSSTWTYSSQPDPRIGNHTSLLYQGRGFGGGSAVGSLSACRGAPSVYDEWAEISGDEGLQWANLLNNFKATTRFTEEQLDYDPHISLDAYGDGPVELTAPSEMQDLGLGFLQSWEEVLSLSRADLNDGTSLGSTTGTQTIRASNRTRDYAAQAYGWQIAGRSNVQEVYNAEVTHIGFKNTRAVSVTYVDSASGRKTTLRPKEVIVAAGAIHTPKLLMLSGIGPADHLASLGIEVVANIPEVGQNLRNHHLAYISWQVGPNVDTLWQYTENATFAAQAEADYIRDGSGPLGNSNSPAFALFRPPTSWLEQNNHTYHASLPEDRAHLLYQYASSPLSSGPNVSTISAFVALAQPEATGYLELASADYHDAPLIYSNHFGSRFAGAQSWTLTGDIADKALMDYGFKRLRGVINNAAVRPFLQTEIAPGGLVKNDVEMWDSLSKVTTSLNNPVGTVALGTVVDGGTWKIKGLDGIRVVDSSTFPTIPTCHIMAAVYAYAHHAAQLIKAQDS